MRVLNEVESGSVGGGTWVVQDWNNMDGGSSGYGGFLQLDSASTRVSTGAGWGGGNGGSPGTDSICYTVQAGPVSSQTCYMSDGTTSVQNCVNVGPSASVGGVGLGVTVNVCNTPAP